MTNLDRNIPSSNLVQSTADKETLQQRSDALDSHTLRNSPPTLDKARADLNAPVAENARVPDMNEGDDNLVATGAGTLGGAAVGAVAGLVGGPPGALVGGVIGGIVGGIAGNDIAQPDHKEEDRYWREQHQQTPYYSETRARYADLDYDRDYREAYRLGYDDRTHYASNINFDEVEPDLQRKWEQVKGESRLTWEQAKFAVRDAWQRATR